MDNWNLIESGALVWIKDNLRVPFLDGVMIGASTLNNAGMLAIITVLALILFKKYRQYGITAGASLLVEFILINVIIKPLVHRTRPFYVNEALNPDIVGNVLGKVPTDYSFPSGHTGAAFAVAFVMFFTMPKKIGIPAIVVASLIAFSRLYNACHYPTDVLCALLIALFTSILATKLVFPRITKFLEEKRNKAS